MSEFVARVDVYVNGSLIPNVKAARELDFPTAKEVILMRQTGTVDITSARVFELDYVVPKLGQEYDWENLKAATVVYELDGGRRKVYSDCRTLSPGQVEYDNQNEAVRTVKIFGSNRNIE